MKTFLIDFNQDISSIGVRYISSYLKKNKIQTRILFLPFKIVGKNDPKNKFASKEKEEELRQIIKLIKREKPDLIGISLMTHFFHRAVGLTKALKNKMDIPIIWGGVHPSIAPEECLKYADIVCIGEGEEAYLELAKKIKEKKSYEKVKSLWIKKEKKIIKNPVRPLEENLDKYPFPDYENDTHYILYENKIRKMNLKLLKKHLPSFDSKETYRIICSRGCPFSCSYCYNSIFRSLYPNPARYLRRRSVENIIQELEWAINFFGSLKLIRIMDDSFIAVKEEWIDDFSIRYKERVGLPISCLINPQTITKNKMDSLWKAGVSHVQMGVESCEQVNKNVYLRNTTDRQILGVIDIINKKKEILPEYDIIIDNPYETKKDVKNKIKLIMKFPKPYILSLYSLVLYPKSPLFERAKKENKLCEKNTSYLKNMSNVNYEYYNSLLLLTPYLPKKWVNYYVKNDDTLSKILIFIIRQVYELSLRMPRSVKKILKGVL